MTGPNYWDYPIFLLYWVALKKKTSIKEWYDELRYNSNNSDVIIEVLDFVEKYGTE